jgi:hypothetical protein
MHRRSGLSPATLKTLYALQDGVTRDREAEAKNRGGVGFQEVIAMMNLLGGVSFPGQEPRLTIVSGTSCISLRTPLSWGRGCTARTRLGSCGSTLTILLRNRLTIRTFSTFQNPSQAL